MSTQEVRQSPGAESGFYYGYIIVLAIFVIAAVVEGIMFSFGVFFKPLLTEFGWTRAMTAGAFSLFTVLHIPIVIAAGALTDRFGPRLMLTACGFFLGLGYLLMSQTSAIWQLYLFYGVVASIGMGLYWVPVISILPRWFVKRRALMIGVAVSGIGVGQLIYPPVANWLISAYDWRMSFLLMGGTTMGIIMISAQFLRRDPGQIGLSPYGESEAKQEYPVVETSGLSLREAIRTKQFWVFGMIYLSWTFCLSTVLVHSVIHAIGLGISPASAANILAIIGVTGIIGRLVFGRLADIIDIKPVLLISFLLMSIDFLWLVIAGEIWMVYLFAAIFGISYGAFEILQSPIIARLFGLSSLGTILGVVHTFASIGLGLGSVVTGYIFDVSGSYQVAFLICAAMAFICVISAALLPLTRGKKKRGIKEVR